MTHRSRDGERDGGVGRVLLVEDDPLVADVVRELLATLAEVHCAASVEEAESVLSGEPWDLVIADVELPGASGIELLRTVGATRPHAATLILSGHASFDYAVEAIRAGADDYMTKPIDPPRLVAKVAELLASARDARSQV